jgi:hypothetical protein
MTIVNCYPILRNNTLLSTQHRLFGGVLIDNSRMEYQR